MRKFFLGVASLLLIAGNINATSIGFAKDGSIVKTSTFRLGNDSIQGQAIRLSKAKLQQLKGKTIDSAEFAFASKNTTGSKAHVFITTSLGGDPIAEGDINISRAFKLEKWTLATPYTITGEEENLYIGYTAIIPTSYKLLVGDGSFDISGCNYGLKDGEWVDTYGTGKGSAYISFNVDGVADYCDAIIGKMNFESYYKAGNDYTFAARFVNVGTKAINSFDAAIEVAGKQTTQHFEGLNIGAKANYSFYLPTINTEAEGKQDINIKIYNINGGDNDVDMTDNSLSGSMFFYPSYMERSILIENFTGQDCSACPGGHTTLSEVIRTSDEDLVEVTHHAGYYPDRFTMTDDAACLFFYSNPTSTYAPAVMVNRTACTDVETVPVINVSSANTKKLISNAATNRPYASLNLETKLDESTRKLNVKLSIKPHEALPGDSALFQIYLVQDGLQAYQAAGGDSYTHNRVCRGTVTGNPWGYLVKNLTPGKASSWETTITIPDSIHSSYWTDSYLTDNGTMYNGKYKVSQTNIEAVLENMSVVAFLGEYDSADNTKNKVYNCTEAKVGESHMQHGFDYTLAIDNAKDEKPEAKIYVAGGKVYVDGSYDKLYVYSITGGMVDAQAQLAKGAYIVKVVANGKQTTKKILVK